MNNEPKISLMEAYLLIAFAVIADCINWIPYVNWIVTLITLPAYQFYFYCKGIRGIYSLSGNIAEAIPIVSALPAITAGVIATIIMDRVSAKVPMAGKVLKAPGVTKPGIAK